MRGVLLRWFHLRSILVCVLGKFSVLWKVQLPISLIQFVFQFRERNNFIRFVHWLTKSSGSINSNLLGFKIAFRKDMIFLPTYIWEHILSSFIYIRAKIHYQSNVYKRFCCDFNSIYEQTSILIFIFWTNLNMAYHRIQGMLEKNLVVSNEQLLTKCSKSENWIKISLLFECLERTERENALFLEVYQRKCVLLITFKLIRKHERKFNDFLETFDICSTFPS